MGVQYDAQLLKAANTIPWLGYNSCFGNLSKTEQHWFIFSQCGSTNMHAYNNTYNLTALHSFINLFLNNVHD